MNYRFASSMQSFSSSAVREILKLTQGNSIVSFAGGLPAEEYFPTEAVKEAFNRVFETGQNALQYGLTEGFTPLREAIAARMSRKGMNVDVNEMLITTGSQQAIDLLTRVYIDPGDVILVEKPTYLAAIQVFNSHGARLVSVDTDADGMNLEDAAAKIAAHQPKMVYVIPTFSNPTGRVWSVERRKGLVELCRKNNVLILEDDPYGEIQFEKGAHYPTLFSLGGAAQGNPVVYTSTFSKTVAPALRTGWAIGDAELIRNMARAKQAADLHSSTMDQQALYQLLTYFDLDAHIAVIREQYEQRMSLMVSLLKELNWPGLHWNDPKGGMFLWVELPEDMRADELLKIAVKEGVAFVPGSTFFAEDAKHNTLRLNFSHSNEAAMRQGMQAFASALRKITSGATV